MKNHVQGSVTSRGMSDAQIQGGAVKEVWMSHETRNYNFCNVVCKYNTILLGKKNQGQRSI